MSEIGELKRELLALRTEVAALRCRVEVLESIGEFEVVRGEDPPLLGEGTEGFGTTSASAATTSAVAVAPGAREPAPLADSGVAEGWGERAEVAKEIGQFLKRGLAGEIVPSGRSKLGLKSRLYLLLGTSKASSTRTRFASSEAGVPCGRWLRSAGSLGTRSSLECLPSLRARSL